MEFTIKIFMAIECITFKELIINPRLSSKKLYNIVARYSYII